MVDTLRVGDNYVTVRVADPNDEDSRSCDGYLSYSDYQNLGGSANFLRAPFLKKLRASSTNFVANVSDKVKPDLLDRKRFIDQGYNDGRPIPFSMDLATRIKTYLLNNRLEDMRYLIIPDDIVRCTGNETKRFACSLEAYKKSPNPLIPIVDLINGITDINFAKSLKKIRTKSFIESTGNQIIDRQPDYEICPSYTLEHDIGDIFNYNYWFFWEEEPEDDLIYADIPCPRISDRSKEIFRETLMSILPDEIEAVREEEILYSTGSSMGLDEKDFSSKPVYKLREEANKFASKPDVTKRSHIRVGPANIRDTVIQSVGRTNSVRLIEKQCSEIAEKIIYSAHVRDPFEFEKRVSIFQRTFNLFFNRDIEKEGITKPRELIQLTLEVLKEKYPGFPAWKYGGIYDDWIVFDRNAETVQSKKRGHGLGMANSLTTIIQSVIFRITLERLNEEGDVNEGISAIFLNDDATIGFIDENDYDSYLDIEEEVFNEYRLRRKLSKSHVGPAMVFCEIYYQANWSRLNDKISFKLNELFGIFAAPNISVAKIISSNLSRHVLCSDIVGIINEIVGFWSFEFFDEEWKYPSTMGGWISPTYQGVRLDFQYYTPSYEVQRAIRANLESRVLRKRTRFKGKRLYQDPLSSRYPDLNLPEEIKNRLNYRVPMRQIIETLSKYNNREEAEEAMLDYYDKRRRIYEEKIDRLETIAEIYKRVVDSYDNKDFLPPKDIVGERISELSSVYNEKIHYRSSNPLLSLLAVYDREKMPKSIIPERWSFLYDMNNRKMTVDERNLVKRYLKYSRDSEILAIPPIDYSDRMFSFGHEYYIKPECVRGASEAFHALQGLPIPSLSVGLEPRFTEEEISTKLILFRRVSSAIARVLIPHSSVEFVKSLLIDLDYNDLLKIQDMIRAKTDPVLIEDPETESLEEADIPGLSIDIKEESSSIPYGPDEFWSWEYNRDPDREENCPWIDTFYEVRNLRCGENIAAGYREITKSDIMDDTMLVSEGTEVMLLVRYVWMKSGGTFHPDGRFNFEGGVDSSDGEEEHTDWLFGQDD